MDRFDVTVIGGGVIGLAVARRLSLDGLQTVLVEKEASFGNHTSSRNSEVIHSGIYYPENSLKHILCIEGREELYRLCEKTGIPYNKTGKLIVACSEDEKQELNRLYDNGRKNGLKDIKYVSSSEAAKLCPGIICIEALHLGYTGLIDSHQLMKYFLMESEKNGCICVFSSEAVETSHINRGYIIQTKSADEAEFSFLSDIVINSAGLDADIVAARAGIDVKSNGYAQHYCKGSYFRVSGLKNRFQMPVYPAVPESDPGLGIHITPDLAGEVRLGPDAQYLEVRNKDYSVEGSLRKRFFDSVVNFFPGLDEKKMVSDTSGIRPKLQGQGEKFRDFVIQEEKGNGFPGFINLIGIESPGLTACTAIAEKVRGLI